MREGELTAPASSKMKTNSTQFCIRFCACIEAYILKDKWFESISSTILGRTEDKYQYIVLHSSFSAYDVS